MFALWCLVLWGTLWDLSLLYTLLTRGMGAAGDTLFVTPLESAGAAWGSRLCGLFAVIVWAFVLGGRWTSTRKPA
jgi:hypothetical protein